MVLPFDPIREARRQWGLHGWDAPDEMAAVTSLIRATQIAMARIDEALRPLDLTFSRYEALVLLHFSRDGALPLGKVGERLMVHPASVTNTIDRLEAEGFVERVPHPTDRRSALARITPAGSKVMDAATAVLVDVDFGLTGLDSEAVTAIEALLAPFRRDAGDYDAEADRASV